MGVVVLLFSCQKPSNRPSAPVSGGKLKWIFDSKFEDTTFFEYNASGKLSTVTTYFGKYYLYYDVVGNLQRSVLESQLLSPPYGTGRSPKVYEFTGGRISKIYTKKAKPVDAAYSNDYEESVGSNPDDVDDTTTITYDAFGRIEFVNYRFRNGTLYNAEGKINRTDTLSYEGSTENLTGARTMYSYYQQGVFEPYKTERMIFSAGMYDSNQVNSFHQLKDLFFVIVPDHVSTRWLPLSPHQVDYKMGYYLLFNSLYPESFSWIWGYTEIPPLVSRINVSVEKNTVGDIKQMESYWDFEWLYVFLEYN